MAGERVTKRDRPRRRGRRPQVLAKAPSARPQRATIRHLGVKGRRGDDRLPGMSGHPWDSPEALALVREAAGADAKLIYTDSVERFDVLPLLVATDGAIEYMGFDGRRLRPNIVVGGVEGLAERSWPGRRLQVGEAVIHAAQLRGRCVMTTFDPDNQRQDLNILRRIVRDLDGVMALDCDVVTGGIILEGDPVEII